MARTATTQNEEEMPLRISSLPQTRKSRLSSKAKENIGAYLFLLPWFAGVIFLTAGPMLSSL
ncbi:MAG: hypothetical protein J2P36_36890, partial [Ktedonobacteraceae bacterium]|nr:hypothetical protein [Ktedonobacteraceae bacterium]